MKDLDKFLEEILYKWYLSKTTDDVDLGLPIIYEYSDPETLKLLYSFHIMERMKNNILKQPILTIHVSSYNKKEIRYVFNVSFGEFYRVTTRAEAMDICNRLGRRIKCGIRKSFRNFPKKDRTRSARLRPGMIVILCDTFDDAIDSFDIFVSYLEEHDPWCIRKVYEPSYCVETNDDLRYIFVDFRMVKYFHFTDDIYGVDEFFDRLNCGF